MPAGSGFVALGVLGLAIVTSAALAEVRLQSDGELQSMVEFRQSVLVEAIAGDRRARLRQSHSGEPASEILLAQIYNYKFINVFPFPVDVKVYGDGPGFPKVVRVPTPPAGSVPIPFPGTKMKIKVRKPNGSWSKTFTLNWNPGGISIPAF